MHRNTLFVLSLVLGICFSGSSIAEQEKTANEVSFAQAQFRIGVAAAEQGQWLVAYEALRRAYAAVPNPSVLLNLGGAEIQTGRLVEAAESYRRFLREAKDQRFEAHLESVAKLLTELEQRLPHIEIRIERLKMDEEIKLDGRPLLRSIVGAPLAINPGDHVVTIHNQDEEIGRISLSVAEGDYTRLPIKRSVSPKLPATDAKAPGD